VVFFKEIENMFSVFLLNYRNTCESLGELEKAVKNFACSSILVPEAIYEERRAMERGRGMKQGRGKIASGRLSMEVILPEAIFPLPRFAPRPLSIAPLSL